MRADGGTECRGNDERRNDPIGHERGSSGRREHNVSQSVYADEATNSFNVGRFAALARRCACRDFTARNAMRFARADVL